MEKSLSFDCPIDVHGWDNFPLPEESALDTSRVDAFILEFLKIIEAENGHWNKVDIRCLIATIRVFFASLNKVAASPRYVEDGEIGVTGAKNTNRLAKDVSRLMNGAAFSFVSIGNPENGKKNGYFLRFDPGEGKSGDETSCSNAKEAFSKILRIYESLIQRFHRGPDCDSDRFGIEASIRERIQSVVSEVREGIDLTAKNPRFDPVNTEILRIFFDSEVDDELVCTLDYLAGCLDGKFTGNLSDKMSALMASLRRSEISSICLGAQINAWNRKAIGYYVDLKEKKEKSGEEKLCPPIRDVISEDRVVLLKLLDNAIIKTPLAAESHLAIFRALKAAYYREGGASVTPEYCLYTQRNMLSGYKGREKNPQLRSIINEFPRVKATAAKGYGIEIIEEGRRWQAVLPKSEEGKTVATRSLEEIESRNLSVKEKGSLKFRVQNGMRHLLSCTKSCNRSAIKDAYEFVLKSTFDARPISITEIFAAVKELGREITWEGVNFLLQRVRSVNKQYPELLGFDVCEVGSDRYMFVLKDEYRKAETLRYRGISPYPIDIRGGVFASKDVFDAFLKKIEERVARNAVLPYCVEYFQVLKFLVDWSLKGKAISKRFTRDALAKKNIRNIYHHLIRIKKILEENFDEFGLVVFEYDEGTIYIDVDCAHSLKNKIAEIEKFIVSNDVAIDDIDRIIAEFRAFNDDFERRLCALEKPGSANSAESTKCRDVCLFTYHGFKTPKGPMLYGGLIDQKFAIVDASDLGESVYKDKARSLDLAEGEVLVALDGKVERISKINVGLVVPIGKKAPVGASKDFNHVDDRDDWGYDDDSKESDADRDRADSRAFTDYLKRQKEKARKAATSV